MYCHTLYFVLQTILFNVILFNNNLVYGYFADWGGIGSRPQEPTCVKIPDDMSLCSGIGYQKMRLPNLLDHGSVHEAKQQSGSWVPLLNVRCHPDTQLFLCSLFTPVCLETAIYPCRSLCTAVRDKCEARMRTYGYHWPDMLNCDNFPLDNDMCIKAQHSTPSPSAEDPCEVCSPVETFENILDNFCRSDFVIRVKFKKQRKNQLIGKKPRVYKKVDKMSSKLLRRPKITLTAGASCCSIKSTSKPFLIMGITQGDTLIPTFLLSWQQFKKLKHPVKKFQQLDCSNPDLFTTTVLDNTSVLSTSNPKDIGKKAKKRRKGKGTKGRRKKKVKKVPDSINDDKIIVSNSTINYNIPIDDLNGNVELTPKPKRNRDKNDKRRRKNKPVTD